MAPTPQADPLQVLPSFTLPPPTDWSQDPPAAFSIDAITLLHYPQAVVMASSFANSATRANEDPLSGREKFEGSIVFGLKRAVGW
jgi:hypothetical protein